MGLACLDSAMARRFGRGHTRAHTRAPNQDARQVCFGPMKGGKLSMGCWLYGRMPVNRASCRNTSSGKRGRNQSPRILRRTRRSSPTCGWIRGQIILTGLWGPEPLGKGPMFLRGMQLCECQVVVQFQGGFAWYGRKGQDSGGGHGGAAKKREYFTFKLPPAHGICYV